MKQALRYALVVGGAVVSILLFLLASASDNSGFFDRSWYNRAGVERVMGYTPKEDVEKFLQKDRKSVV